MKRREGKVEKGKEVRKGKTLIDFCLRYYRQLPIYIDFDLGK